MLIDICLKVRTVAFGMRAALAKSDSAAHQKNVVLAEMIIYSIGFFGVVSSAYLLVLDRYVSYIYLDSYHA